MTGPLVESVHFSTHLTLTFSLTFGQRKARGSECTPLACVRFLWHRSPAGLRGLIIRLPTLRSLGIVRSFGRVSDPFTNEQCRTQERKVKNRKSSYFEVISSLQFEACNDALKRIVPRIDFNQINALIDDVEGISEVRKRFYKVMLHQRYEKILMYAYRQL